MLLALIAFVLTYYALATAADDPNESAETDDGLARLRNNGLI